MYFVYVLRSEKDGKRYVGSGSDPSERLRKHNGGSNRFTKGHRPWRLVHVEECADKTAGRKRENFLKTGAGRAELDRKVI